jgi:hypothetical protein
MTHPTGGDPVWSEIGSQLQLLAISGAAGAAFRAAFAPEKEWRRRIVQGIFGAVAAVFLGGVVAGIINSFVDTGVYAYLCAGFVMGSGGEAAVRAIQNRLIGPDKKL